MKRRGCICSGAVRTAPGAHGPLCPRRAGRPGAQPAQGRPVEAGGCHVLYDDGLIYVGTLLFDRSAYLGRPLRRG